MSVNITTGNKEVAIHIMREAAQWSIGIERPLWDLNDLSMDNLINPPDEFHVMRDGEESIAAMILSFEDRFFWPHIPANTSGFIHKLAVRRKFAGQGYAKQMVEQAKKVCRAKGIHYLRLDCDSHREGLLRLYGDCGFTLVEVKKLNLPKLGTIDIALHEMKLS